MTRLPLLTLAAGLALVAGVPLVVPHALPDASAAAATPGVQLPSGRLVTPAGSPYDTSRATGDASYDLGDFPVGLSLSPDGRFAVASLNGYGEGVPQGFNSTCQAGQQLQGVSCPGVPASKRTTQLNHSPDEGLDVVDLATGKVTQAVAIPTDHTASKARVCAQTINCFGIGVAFSPDSKHVYATGAGSDQVYDFAVSGTTLTLAHAVAVPSTVEQTPAAPVLGKTFGGPRGLAVTPDGKTLVVTSEFDSTVELFDLTGATPTLVAQGLLPGGVSAPTPVAYLYGAAVSPDSAFAYVTAQGTGVVYAIDLALLRATGATTTGAPAQLKALSAAVVPVAVPVPGLDHPTGLSVSPDGSTLAVAGANSDTVALVPLVQDVPQVATAVQVPVAAVTRSGVLGSVPNAVAWAGNGRVYAAMAGDDAVAAIDLAPSPHVAGVVPQGWYPTGVAVGPKDGRLYTLAAKGLGSRYVPALGYTARPGTSLPSGSSIPSADYYDGDNMPGLLTRVTVPKDLTAYTALARQDVLHAGGLDQRTAHDPVPVAVGGTSPITHVVYVVRENRTYDQEYGDLALTRKDSDGDPADQLLAAATPNGHSVVSQFASADHFFSDGEASVQGHWWTSSANSSDYMEKSWRQYYSNRNRPYDPIGTVVNPPGCSIFQAMQAHQATDPTFSFKNYGELVGLTTPNASVSAPAANVCAGAGPIGPGTIPSDPNYPTQISLVPDDRTRSTEFLKDSGMNLDGSSNGNGGSLKNFSYLILSEDHTSGLAGTNTPRSQVSQNDQALGQIVSGLSKSQYWSSTAVFVVEDDSQDGFDHLDGHRNVLLVASPYTKHVSGDSCVPGYIGHTHYDQASVLRTMELVLGIPPLSAYDSGATPLYDLFQDKDSAAQLTKADLAPYAVAKAPPFVDEQVASLPKSTKNAALVSYSKSLDTTHVDASEAGIEDVLWQSVRSDAVPFALADKVGAPELGESAALSTAQVTDALQPSLVRPGAAPAISTVTGKPLVAGQKVTCAAPVAVTHPIAPGQTHLGGGTPTGHLPTTGLPVWPELLASGLLLVALGSWRLRART